MDFITSHVQILQNILALHRLSRSSDKSARKYHHDRIRKGHSFVCTERNSQRIFAPSRFAGYKNNNVARHERNSDKNGWDTNKAISALLGAPRMGRALETEFKRYCSRHGIVPENRRRRYWTLGI